MPTVTTRQGPTMQDHIDDVSAAHHATRHITLPPMVVAVVWGTAFGLHHAPGWLVALVWVVGGVLIVTGYDHSFRLPGRRERIWAVSCVTAMAAGAAWWTWAGPSPDPWWLSVEVTVSAAVALALGVPWTWHRRVRRGVQVSRRIRAFSRDTLDGIGLKNVDAPLSTAVATDEYRWEIDLVPQGSGWTLDKMQRCVPQLAAWLGLAEGKVTIVEKPGRKGRPFRGRLLVDESEGAPVAVTVTLPEGPTDIREPYRKGELTGGGTLYSQWWREEHGSVAGVAGGQLGSGKTGAAERDAMQLVTSTNALDPWIYDGKPGSPNWAPWGPRDDGFPALADWYTTSPDGFRAMVMACWAIAETRGAASEHEPTAADPFVGVICDESAIVFAPNQTEVTATFKDRRTAERYAEQIVQATEEYAQIHRATGTALRLSTVRPEHRSTGNATVRSFLMGGECAGYATSNPRDGEFLFSGREVPVHRIPQNEPGTGFFKNFCHPEPVRARVDFFDHKKITKAHPDNTVEQLRRWKRDHPDASPGLPDAALASIRAKIGDVYDRRHDATTGASAVAGAWPACPTCRAEQTDVDLAVGQCLGCGHELTDAEAQALATVALAKVDRDVDAQTAGDEPAPLPEPEAPSVPPAPTRYESAHHARQHCLDALRSLGDGWHRAADVRGVIGEHKSQDIVTGRLGELLTGGAVERRGRRDRTEWRAVRATVDPPEQDPDSTGTGPGEDPNRS